LGPEISLLAPGCPDFTFLLLQSVIKQYIDQELAVTAAWALGICCVCMNKVAALFFMKCHYDHQIGIIMLYWVFINPTLSICAYLLGCKFCHKISSFSICSCKSGGTVL